MSEHTNFPSKPIKLSLYLSQSSISKINTEIDLEIDLAIDLMINTEIDLKTNLSIDLRDIKDQYLRLISGFRDG